MQTLNRKILIYLLVLWSGIAALGAVGYSRLNAVHHLSRNLVEGSALAAQAALQVESSLHEAYKSTYLYCQYIIPEARSETEEALRLAEQALERYRHLRQNGSEESYAKLSALLTDVRQHSLDCLKMTDEGMTPEEFETHVPELVEIQLQAALALREAANNEQELMVSAASDIDRVTKQGIQIFIGGALLSLLVTVAIGYLLSRAILPPVQSLTQAARQFAAEDLSVRVEENHAGEFGMLAKAFNTMAASIQMSLQENARLFSSVNESREKFQDLYDNAPDGYHSLGSNGSFVEINQTELEWLGYEKAELVGQKSMTDILSASSRSEFQEVFERLKRDGAIEDLEVELVRKDGTVLAARINSVAVFDAEGNFLRSRDTVRDICREKELHGQLIQAQKLESIGTLAGGIAHDFNNLLTSIMGFAQLAMIEFDPKTKTYRNLERVVHLGDQAAGLIKQLLTFSRQAPSQKLPISLVPLVKETGKVMQRTLPETIQIHTQTQQNLPSVEADATQMQQILMNLCVNARDAMPDGGELTLSLTAEEVGQEPIGLLGSRTIGSYVCLTVEDSGAGIPIEIQQRMFEPFFTTKEVGKGTGLGLAMVHGIVESHGGHIQVHSSPGEGTRFKIYLPAIMEAATVPLEKNSFAPSGSETLLLVEDDVNVREIAQKMLEGQGYSILVSPDGQDGLEQYHIHRDAIDLVITDLVMPGLSGTELFNRLVEFNPDVRVLFISGYNKQEETLAALNRENAVGYLQKPFDLSILARTVREALDGSRVPA